MSAAEARFWVCDPNPENVLDNVSEAVGHPVVGIVDEREGGMIAYAAAEFAQKIVANLNAEAAR